jgi:hypothetical protein
VDGKEAFFVTFLSFAVQDTTRSGWLNVNKLLFCTNQHQLRGMSNVYE